MIFYVFADGSCYNDPEHNTAGYAACLAKTRHPETLEEIYHISKGWFLDGTNNQAEWAGFNAALRIVEEWQKKYPTAEFIILSDSQLIISQALGIYEVRNKSLLPFYAEFKIIVEALDMNHVGFKWIPRTQNILADKLSKDVNPYFIKKRLNELAKRRSTKGI